MSYRDEQAALRERIEILEREAEQALSPEEARALREELQGARARLDEEQAKIDQLLLRLGGEARATPKAREVEGARRKWLLVAFSALVVLFASGAASYFALGPTRPPRVRRSVAEVEPELRGAPNAVRSVPRRAEVDVEVARLFAELDGCLPQGRNARVQVEALFEGEHGAVRAVSLRNISEHDGIPPGTFECIEQTFMSVGVPPFRMPAFRYPLTLEWTRGRLQRPPLWDRHGLVEGADSHVPPSPTEEDLRQAPDPTQ